MEETPRRSLVSALSFLWTTNCPSWLYAIKCSAMNLAALSLLIAGAEGLAGLPYEYDSFEVVGFIGVWIWVIAGILRWFANGVDNQKAILYDVFVNLEGALFWVPTLWFFWVALGWFLPFSSDSPTIFDVLVPVALGFVVAKLLRRATSPV